MASSSLVQLLVEITGQGQGWTIQTEYNIAPTQQVGVLRQQADGDWDLTPMRWWLVPYWSPEPSTKYSMFNAKSETLQKSRAFRENCVALLKYRLRRIVVRPSLLLILLVLSPQH